MHETAPSACIVSPSDRLVAGLPPNRRILVVDDNTSIHEDVRKILSPRNQHTVDLERDAALMFGTPVAPIGVEESFEIDSAMHGEEAITLVRRAVSQQRPFALAFVDVRMPRGIDGIETTKAIWNIDAEVQVVLCTAYSDYTLQDVLGQLGMTGRFLVLKKPYDPMELAMFAITMTAKWNHAREAARVIRSQSTQIEDSGRVLKVLRACQSNLERKCLTLQQQADQLSSQIQQQTIELLGTREITCLALAQLAESRDPETGEHLYRMQAFSQILAEQLALDGPYVDQIDPQFLEDLWRSTPLHDIGKVGIPDEVLLKPGKLTTAEFELMKRHTTIGAEALDVASRQNDFGGFLTMAVEIARYHHEWFDGAGYPFGLSGSDIPLTARIVAVADVFDALTSKRVYKDAMSPALAMEIIESESGTHFDPAVVDACRSRFAELVKVQQEINESGRLNGACIAIRTPASRSLDGESNVSHEASKLLASSLS